MNKYKTIGILGGMGPEGTVDMYMKVFKYFQDNFGAKYDSDFPPFVIYSVPIPDVVESVESEKETLKMLSNAAKKLEQFGCDFIVIACNTVQFLLDGIRQSVTIPVVGIAEVNAKYIKDRGLRKVGILATETTVKKGVYQKNFQNIGIDLIKPDETDQNTVTQVIMTQLAGKITKNETQKLLKVVSNLKQQGAEVVLIACTDLPPVLNQDDTSVPLIDCTEVYANETARLASETKMTNKPVIISDLGGVIYSFSESFDAEEYEKQFVNALSWYSENNTKYKNALIEYNNGNLNLALDIEREAVIKGLNNENKVGGTLTIYISIEAAKRLLNNAKKFKVVIVSTSRKETSLAIIKEAFKQIGEGQESIDKIISQFDIFDMSVYGSKKDSNAWKEILKNYQNLIAIVEDSEKNLNAAIQAATELGQKPKGSQSMVES